MAVIIKQVVKLYQSRTKYKQTFVTKAQLTLSLFNLLKNILVHPTDDNFFIVPIVKLILFMIFLIYLILLIKSPHLFKVVS